MIDLRSDTVTRPDEAMRKSGAEAAVGDDVYGEDPTVNELEARAADVLGTEDALFCVSGTMANQIAARTHTERGQEVLCEARSHIFSREVAGLAQHAGLQTRPIEGDDRGAIAPGQVEANLAEADDHQAGTGLLALENTHNRAGGTALAPEIIAEAADVARRADVPVHLDGARVWNAAVAHETPVSAFVEPVDSVMASFSKGLGAPMGSILAGGAEFVTAARRVRKLLGGGWRQAGVVAAPALLGLENRDRLRADHERARRLAAGLADLEGVAVGEPETNIVLVETAMPAESFLDVCESEGVLGVQFGEHVTRFCTHRDVDDGDVESAIEAVAAAV